MSRCKKTSDPVPVAATRTPGAAEQPTFPLAGLLQHVGKLLDDLMRVQLDELGLHPSQGRVLRLLLRRGDGLGQRDLTRLMRVSAPTLSGILKRLEAQGLVRREADPHDGRGTRIHRTARGRQKSRAADAAISEMDRRLTDGLSATQLRSAHTLLRKCRNNLGGEPPIPDPPVRKIVP